MKLRPARADDVRLFWRWANDRATRAASYASAPIPWADHRRWFAARLAARDRVRIYVAEDGTRRPVGQIRFEVRRAGDAEISFSVAPRRRGRGLGTALLARGWRRARRDLRLRRAFGWVKQENPGAQRAFLRAGFTRVRANLRRGVRSVLFQILL